MMSKINTAIDINCDLGEGMPNDALLMPFLGSCNIACGGHYGNAVTIYNALALAKKYDVKIGAHPSYPDHANFGRISLDIEMKALKESLLSQLAGFAKVCQSQNLKIHHIKPHGALYNDLAKRENLATMFLDLIRIDYPDAILYCPPSSIISELAPQFNVKIALEIFADRNYEDDLTLVSRNHPKALLTNPDEVYGHVKTMVFGKSIKTISGKSIPVNADTLCVHGDNPAALEILKMIHTQISI
ncbi:5-oxoprolinase subunit PxpA [Belliella marina]|uniref:5-oxoprolinase subunit PxpA n=1 Tax=Belliella marina TaxID=1644146 RepID=A0ABW4VPF2_9BACT